MRVASQCAMAAYVPSVNSRLKLDVCLQHVLIQSSYIVVSCSTLDSEIFARILFLQIALKDILVM